MLAAALEKLFGASAGRRHRASMPLKLDIACPEAEDFGADPQVRASGAE